jgi:hypothetical protein
MKLIKRFWQSFAIVILLFVCNCNIATAQTIPCYSIDTAKLDAYLSYIQPPTTNVKIVICPSFTNNAFSSDSLVLYILKKSKNKKYSLDPHILGVGVSTGSCTSETVQKPFVISNCELRLSYTKVQDLLTEILNAKYDGLIYFKPIFNSVEEIDIAGTIEDKKYHLNYAIGYYDKTNTFIPIYKTHSNLQGTKVTNPNPSPPAPPNN